jgi:acyl-coenzyme A synthetase/AMP-(fatty) acid ligase
VRAALARREGGALVVDVELDGESHGEPDLAPLRQALRAALPAGAQPAALRRVASLPRTDRGKRDRG